MDGEIIGSKRKTGGLGGLGPLLFGLAYLAAFGLAAWRFWCSEMHLDYAACGLLGLAMSKGQFPLFFYGQDFMGSLDGLLAAPLYFIFGPSSLALNFWPPVLWIGIIAVMHRTLFLLFKPIGVWAGVMLLAVPPAMLICWAGQAQTHYPLALFLGALLIMLTVRLWQQESWGWARPMAWGFVAGLAVWTNFQAAVVVLPCGLFLLATGFRRLFWGPLASFIVGGAAGAGPLLYYNLTHGWPHLAQGGSFHAGLIQGRLEPLFVNAIPLIVGFNPFYKDGAPDWGAPLFLLYILVLLILVWAKLGLLGEGLQRERRILWLPLMVGVTNLLVLLFSSYGRLLGNSDQRYFLPLYLSLPFLWAWLAGRLGKRRAWPAIVLVLGFLALHVVFYSTNVYCGREMRCEHGGYHQRQEPMVDKFVALMREKGMHTAYCSNSLIFSFLAGDDPVFSRPWDDRRASASVKVDASQNPAFVLPMAESLKLMGVGFQHCPDSQCLWEVYHSFQEPRQAARLVEGGACRAKDLAGEELGNALTDGDLGSGFQTPGPAKPGQGFVLDLGKEEELSGFSLAAKNCLDTPGGLKVEAAGGDGVFQQVRKADGLWRTPFYWSGPHPFLKFRFGRVDCYFPPQPVRYLRLTHVGESRGAWSVGEILLYGPGNSGEEVSWPESGDRLLIKVRGAKARHILADAWPAAWLRAKGGENLEVIISNRGQDDYGNGAKSVAFFPLIEPGADRGLVVAKREAGRTAQLLERAGVSFERYEAGRLELFTPTDRSTPRPLEMAAVSSNVDQKNAAALVAGRHHGGRWGSLAPQKPGVHLTVDLGREREVGGFYLGCPNHPKDFPLGLRVSISEDGLSWKPMEHYRVWPLVFSGQLPLAQPGPENQYRLKQPVRARYIRLELNASHPVWWWSVERLAVLGP